MLTRLSWVKVGNSTYTCMESLSLSRSTRFHLCAASTLRQSSCGYERSRFCTRIATFAHTLPLCRRALCCVEMWLSQPATSSRSVHNFLSRKRCPALVHLLHSYPSSLDLLAWCVCFSHTHTLHYSLLSFPSSLPPPVPLPSIGAANNCRPSARWRVSRQHSGRWSTASVRECVSYVLK